jgi:hypothetical protein
MSPIDTTQGINMSTGQVIGGAGTNVIAPAGTGGNIGSSALTTAGGKGITATTPTQVYNMGKVNYPTYADGIRQDAINTGGYDPLQGQGSSALSTKGGQGFNVDAISTAQDNFKEGFNFGQSMIDSKVGRGFQTVC